VAPSRGVSLRFSIRKQGFPATQLAGVILAFVAVGLIPSGPLSGEVPEKYWWLVRIIFEVLLLVFLIDGWRCCAGLNLAPARITASGDSISITYPGVLRHSLVIPLEWITGIDYEPAPRVIVAAAENVQLAPYPQLPNVAIILDRQITLDLAHDVHDFAMWPRPCRFDLPQADRPIRVLWIRMSRGDVIALKRFVSK
jgi:hypothetical protein